MSKQYCWSFNEDDEMYKGPLDSVEDCIKEAKGDAEDDGLQPDHIYIAEAVEKDVTQYLSIDSDFVVETLCENAEEDFVGMENHPINDLSNEELIELEQCIESSAASWLRSKGYDTIGVVDNIQRYEMNP